MLKWLPLLLLAACSGREQEAEPQAKEAAGAAGAPLAPPPAEAGGLPDDGTTVSEEPFTDEGAQGAGQVLQTYYALIETKKYEEAWKLRWQGEGDNRESAAAFAESFERYAEYRATIGTPGPVSGAAGSLYVDVPVQLYGRMKDGKPFGSAGTVTLRRVNDVPGSTAEQRRWRIYSRD